jgi:hypothetical protein
MQTNVFDVPVYRLRRDRYNKEMDEHIERQMYPPGASWADQMRALHEREPALRIQFHDHLWRSYGGMWRYNEIVGYIRLHFLGSQIRGEYSSSIKKRLVRTRTKTFVYQTHKLAAEVTIPKDAASDEIFSLLNQYLLNCQHELPKVHVDTTMFDAVAPYVEWQRLYSEHLRMIAKRAAR